MISRGFCLPSFLLSPLSSPLLSLLLLSLLLSSDLLSPLLLCCEVVLSSDLLPSPSLGFGGGGGGNGFSSSYLSTTFLIALAVRKLSSVF